MKIYSYEPHGFLNEVRVDFAGLAIPTGTTLFRCFAEWIQDKNCTEIIPQWQVESAALLYHIAIGCGEKLKTLTDEKERNLWLKLQKNYKKQSYTAWRRLWQVVAQNSIVSCGKSAGEAICTLLPKYKKLLLADGHNYKHCKAKKDFELQDLPDWDDEE